MGICIGSAVASFLPESYLNTLDQEGTALMNGYNLCTLLTARYVDDILVFSAEEGSLTEVRRNLFQTSPDLTFTFEETEGGELQYYLDFILSTEPGLRWRAGKRSLKSILPAVSSHPKTVKKQL